MGFSCVWLCAVGRSRKILRQATELCLCQAMWAMPLELPERLAMVEAQWRRNRCLHPRLHGR